jgi:hypothetical protein
MAIVIIIGVLLAVIGSIQYLVDTIRGRTKPNRVSWLIWSASPMIGAIASFMDGAGLAIMPAFMAGFLPLLIFISSFFNKNSYWKLGWFDYICGALAVAALVVFIVAEDATVTIIFAIVSDALACVPTVIKSYRHPETESGLFFLLGAASQVTGFIALEAWSFTTAGLLIYIFGMDIMFSILIYGRKRGIRSA